MRYENEYLQHHGVKGMKWGVRRYQNYDGSYTAEGMKRFRKSEAAYDKVAAEYKEGRASKADVKAAKNDMNKKYKQLKKDYAADKGKELYRSGKTITENEKKHKAIGEASAGAIVVAGFLAKNGDKKLAATVGAIGIGTSAVNMVLYNKSRHENKQLRAYYSHSRPKD